MATAGAERHTAYLGLGSNLGDRRANLAAALAALGELGTLAALSSVWRTEPVGFAEQPEFWNMVVELRTPLDARALLDAAGGIEARLGRTRPFRDAPRVLDIDLLFYDDVRIAAAGLSVPHPRVLQRGFTLRPLAELAPSLVPPGSDRTIAQHLGAARGLEAGVRLFPGEDLLAPPGTAVEDA